jgi:polysaccharide biosynthesis protein PelD
MSAADMDDAYPVSASAAPSQHSHAIIETLLFLTAMVLLDALLGQGDRFLSMSVHPFWAIILLVALQYGPGDTLAAAVFSSLFLLVGNMPEQMLTETMYDYILRVTFLPFLWITTALVLGSIRARQLDEKQRLQEELLKNKESNALLVKGYNAIKQAKEKLELRLAEERCSVLTVYKVAKSLEAVDASEITPAVAELVNTAFHPIRFSLYRLQNGVLQLETTRGWKTSHDYTTRFDSHSPLLADMLTKKRVLSVLHADEEAILNKEGMLAGPIIDPQSGKIYGMLKIEEMGFTELNLRAYEIFAVVCQWIARVYANAENHQGAGQSRVMKAANSNIPSADQYLRFFTHFARRQGFNMFKITIRLGNRLLPREQRHHAMRALKEVLHETLRETDLLLNAGGDEKSNILLSCYDEADTQLVATKLQMAIIRRKDPILDKAAFTYDIKVLHLHEAPTPKMAPRPLPIAV